MMYYRQCRLKKGHTQQVAWIPETFAVLGNHVKLHNDNRIWIVDYVGEHRVAEVEVLERKDDYRYQREASDI